MASDIERRKFLATLGGTVVAWPLVARAQQAAMPVVGFVSAGSTDAPLAAAFRKGLNEGGFVQGQNVTAQYHWLAGQHPYKNRGKPRRNGRACGGNTCGPPSARLDLSPPRQASELTVR